MPSQVMKRALRVMSGVIAIVGFHASSTLAAPPAEVRIEVHYNFLSGVSNWTSTGAFADSGVIDVSSTIHHDVRGVSIVVSPLVAADGTFVWKFHKQYVATEDPSVAASHGEFHIVDASGVFAGMTGHGQVSGVVNVETGDVFDIFTGWVHVD